MKRLFMVVGLAAFCSAATAWVVISILGDRHNAQVAAMEAAWQNERDALAADLQSKSTEAPVPLRPSTLLPASETVAPSAHRDCTAIIARLASHGTPGSGREKTVRQAIHDLEELIAAGQDALPAIRAYLARNVDVDFRGMGGEPIKYGTVPETFVIPPTLRFGLLDAVRQIGGEAAEALLAEVLGVSSRGSEVSWLARVLNGMAPGKYRDAALAAAREGLANPRATPDGKGFDRMDRDQFFSVLTMFGDMSYAGTAQSQLVLPDNTVDRSALKYLMQAQGAQSVAIASQLYADSRLSDPSQREPLARLALNFVGADSQANDFYAKAINDMALSKDHRRNLIEDLNQDGFANTKKLTEQDLPLIENRIALIERLAPHATDPVNLAAFQEAYKDLVNMRDRVLRPPVAVKK